ncbi:MAG: L-seryl-tRNA(Sec) selenium transferase [Candidatus Marinimicrobia bacterium]|nr:L-seryl-tRNA(Sec) selenium transferase [Candidatus Neomarinimicrobiota bacterium]
MIKSVSDIPSVHRIKEYLLPLFNKIDEGFISFLVQAKLEALRKKIQSGQNYSKDKLFQDLKHDVMLYSSQLSIRKVINGTGVILHTGLGRAPLSKDLLQQLGNLSGYVQLEFNIEDGSRGERNDHNRKLLNYLCQSEDSIVVNNNAAAVLLSLSALSDKKEVLVSRGQLVEIGGSFRIPDVMAQSGAIMVEVGSTNRTHLRDYEQAISPRTAALFIAHSSNYRIRGFTAFPKLKDIINLAHAKGIPLIYDLGSGILGNKDNILEGEHRISDIVKSACDIVTFSGDKLLGGPQTGILCGKKEFIKKCHKHPLYRALRPDKLILAALQLSLQEYVKKDSNLPTHRYLQRTEEDLQNLFRKILSFLPENFHSQLELRSSFTESGSGTAPDSERPSLAITFPNNNNAKKLSNTFRSLEIIPVIGYINKEIYMIDLAAIDENEAELLAKKIEWVFAE